MPRLAATRKPADQLAEFLHPLQADLAHVTRRLTQSLHDPIAQRVVSLVTSGGKQLRPSLILLAGDSRQNGTVRDALIEIAAAAELIHTATLIHDDIIDRAIVRRQQPTFHQQFGTERAVLMGDYLYATAFTLIATLRHAGVTSIMAEVCQQMSRGELLEVENRYNMELTQSQYLEIVRDKTASLIAACCRLGALVGGASFETVERLGAFGLNFGMAFQIMDDCLDLIGEERVVGKTLRSDLDKGSLSLPIIFLLQELPAEERERLVAPLRTRTQDEAFLARVAGEARRRGAIDQALALAQQFIHNASMQFDGQAQIPCADTFRQLASYTIQRAR